ncbi:hypothetical protein CVU37_13360 [candidate division BRC1 bacterium HGW-BRC1-1]|nr:MAG: hypothetical protein CVU37_13360 [candidate division BRC1 bacterium HGW-BRC1-1]
MNRSYLWSGLLLGLMLVAPLPAKGAGFQLGWGDAPQELGLVIRPEQEPQGPLTFYVKPNGALIVADTVHGNLKEFSADGKLVRVFGAGMRPTALAARADGGLLALEGNEVSTLNSEGTLVSKLEVPAAAGLVEGYAQDVFEEEGMTGVNSPDETVYLFKAQNEGAQPTTATAIRKGRAAGGAARAMTGLVGGRARPVISDGQGTQLPAPVAMKAASPDAVAFGGVIFRGLVGKRTVWETEEITPDGVRLFLRSDGPKPLLEMNNAYFTTVYRKFELRPDGSVWQMRTTPGGVEFSRHEVAQ